MSDRFFNIMAGSDRLLNKGELTAGANWAAGRDAAFNVAEFTGFMGRLGVAAPEAKNIFSALSGGDFTQKVEADRVVATIFGNSDANGDGKLSRSELRDGLQALGQTNGTVSFGRDAGIDRLMDRGEFTELARRSGIADQAVIDRVFNAVAKGADAIDAAKFKEAFGKDVLTNAAFKQKVEDIAAQSAPTIDFDSVAKGGEIGLRDFIRMARDAGVGNWRDAVRVFREVAGMDRRMDGDEFAAAFGGNSVSVGDFKDRFQQIRDDLPSRGWGQQMMQPPFGIVPGMTEMPQFRPPFAAMGMAIANAFIDQIKARLNELMAQPVEAQPVEPQPQPVQMRPIQATTTFSAGDSLSVQILDAQSNEWREVASNRANLRNMNFDAPIDDLSQLQVRLVNNSTGLTYGSDDQLQARVTRLADGGIRIAFEDRPYHRSDKDFNDAVVTFRFAS